MKHLSRKQKAYIDEKTEDEKRRKRRRRYMVRGEVKVLRAIKSGVECSEPKAFFLARVGLLDK